MAKLYNSAMLEVSFKVTADLRIGEEVRLSGSAPALGLWDPNRAVPLVTTPATYPRWTTKESIFLPDGDGDDAIKYRYAVFSGGCFKRWESHQGGETILSKTISLRTVESEIAKSLTEVQNKNKDIEIGSYPFFQAGKLGVSIVIRSEKQSKIDRCSDQILNFVKEMKIEVVER